MSGFLRFFAALALLALVPVSVNGARSEALEYRVYLGGLPLGTLDIGAKLTDTAYQAEGAFRMTALLRIILDSDARATVSGEFAPDGRVQPRAFSYWVRDRDEERVSSIIYDEAGRPIRVEADPPFREKSYDMTIDQARNALDPASAAAALMAPRPDPCIFQQDVFDGRKLHRITLSGGKAGEGGAVVCTGLYERVAGFKAKHMTPDRARYPFRAELRPDDKGGYIARRIWAETRFGDAVALLKSGG